MRTKDFIYLFLFIFIFTPFLFANEDENPNKVDNNEQKLGFRTRKVLNDLFANKEQGFYIKLLVTVDPEKKTVNYFAKNDKIYIEAKSTSTEFNILANEKEAMLLFPKIKTYEKIKKEDIPILQYMPIFSSFNENTQDKNLKITETPSNISGLPYICESFSNYEYSVNLYFNKTDDESQSKLKFIKFNNTMIKILEYGISPDESKFIIPDDYKII